MAIDFVGRHHHFLVVDVGLAGLRIDGIQQIVEVRAQRFDVCLRSHFISSGKNLNELFNILII